MNIITDFGFAATKAMMASLAIVAFQQGNPQHAIAFLIVFAVIESIAACTRAVHRLVQSSAVAKPLQAASITPAAADESQRTDAAPCVHGEAEEGVEFPTVTDLPILNQDEFPAFPEIKLGGTLIAFATEWQNAEKECVAGCIVNACMLAKQWQPIHAESLLNQMKAHPLIAPFMVQGVANALWTLVNDGFVEVVMYQDVNHFVPTPKLAQRFLGNPQNLRVA